MAKKRKPIKIDWLKTYGREQADFRPEEQRFRFTLITPPRYKWVTRYKRNPRTKKRRKVRVRVVDNAGRQHALGPLLISAEWRDEGSASGNLNTIPVMHGTFQLNRAPRDQTGALLDVDVGDIVRCSMRYGGKWLHLWEMRLTKPTYQVEDGNWTWEMADDLELLGKSREDFKFKVKKKSKQRGWLYHEIVQSIAKKYRIPLGSIVAGHHRIKDFTESSVSPLEAIRRVAEEEQKWTGYRYVIKWAWSKKHGKYALHIVHPRRNPSLYEFQEQIQQASIEQSLKAGFATEITATGHGKKHKAVGKKKAKKRAKYVVKMVSDGKGPGYISPKVKGKPRTYHLPSNVIWQHGRVHKDVTIPGQIDSMSELIAKAKRHMATNFEPNRKVSLTHYGIAFVRRGDAIQVVIPEEGMKGKKSVVFVTSAVHTVTAGSYTMALEMGLTDPLDPNKRRSERDAAARRRKAAKKKKPKRK